MSVPTAFADLSTTAASNQPVGSVDAANTIDDQLRQVYAFIRALYEGSTNGQIAFPATQNASPNANTLDDYEEGSFTPSDASGASLTLSSASGRYVKVGKLVSFWLTVTYPATDSTANAALAGLPFAAGALSFYAATFGQSNSPSGPFGALIQGGTTTISIYEADSGGYATNVLLSGRIVYIGGVYEASA